MAAVAVENGRWELYRVLSEPMRLRLLAVSAEEELTIGEIAEVLSETQPKVSRHVAQLKRAGLVETRKEGTRALVKLSDGAGSDPVVGDALRAGRALCVKGGHLRRIVEVVAARDAAVRAFFDEPREPEVVGGLPAELPAYLRALAHLIPTRRLAVDAGTGDGSLLDVLAPVFDRVVALDRSKAQLAQAEERLLLRGYSNVELRHAAFDDPELCTTVQSMGGADVVFASRVLHHAPRPAVALRALAQLLRPGGSVMVIDYQLHDDERLRDQQADFWLGFAEPELHRFVESAGLVDVRTSPIASRLCGDGPDGHLDWLVMVARRQE